MRIEKREEGEYLIGAGTTNSCPKMMRAGDYNTLCCYHLHGEHISTDRREDDGSLRICCRWPIDPEPEQPATTASRILTPAEVRTAQAPRVVSEIERINAALVVGVRDFSVNAPLFEDIGRALEAAGWTAIVSTADGRTSFEVREKPEGWR